MGRRGVFLGRADRFRDTWQLVNPAMTIFGLADDDESIIDQIGGLYPIYPLTKGVETWDVARAVRAARDLVTDVPEVLPDALRDEYDVVDILTAFDWIHTPDERDQVDQPDRLRERLGDAAGCRVGVGVRVVQGTAGGDQAVRHRALERRGGEAVHGRQEQRVVGDDEVGTPRHRLVGHRSDRVHREQHPAHRRRRVADDEPDRVPRLRGRQRVAAVERRDDVGERRDSGHGRTIALTARRSSIAA